MDIYERKLNQDQINTDGFWTKLFADEQSENILAVTEDQISATVNAKILTQEQGEKLKSRKKTMTTAIRRESLKRYPVQVPRKFAQHTYSDKYKKEMSDSKRKRKQNLYGTDLHRKKLNALDVERAESEHQNEKTSLIARFMNTVQTSYPALLRGKSVEDIMAEPEISDRAEFLVDDEAHIFGNLNILFGERLEVVGQECVRQFMELDLSADLRTDKALAKDAERLEKVTSKARAMINLVDNHPEIEESMAPEEKEEFEVKLDRAYALIDYYEMRKSIITDEIYRTHENSELSMRFEPMPADLDKQMDLLESARAQEGQPGEKVLNEQQMAEAEQRAEQYYREQNLIRKIWDADQRASTMSQYTDRKARDNWYHLDLYQSLIEETEQKDTPEIAAAWGTYVRSKISDKNFLKKRPLPPLDPNSYKVKYLNSHRAEDDPVFEAVRNSAPIVGTHDSIADLSRAYTLESWAGLNILSDKEFETMMENFTVFNIRGKKNEKWFSPSDLEQLRNMELDALRSYKKILMGEVEFLKQKYGCGLRLENPFSIVDHRPEIERDMGGGQTITEMFKTFRKYGIMDTNDPADLDMEATMWYLHTQMTAATLHASREPAKAEAGILTSYADMMRSYTLEFERQLNGTDIDTAVKMRIKELERGLDGNHMVSWGLKPSYAPAPDGNES